MHSFNRYITSDYFTSTLGIKSSLDFSGYKGDVSGGPDFERWLVMSLIESSESVAGIQAGNDAVFACEQVEYPDFEHMDSFISIIVQEDRDSTPVITLFEELCSNPEDNTVISVQVPLDSVQSGSLLIVECDRIDSFVATVSGMFESGNDERQIVKLPRGCGLLLGGGHIGGGRIICLLNQKFNL